MPIHIDEQTKHWLATKGKPLAVRLLEVNSCCGPSLQELMTNIGKPKDVEHYHELKIDDIVVYIRRPLNNSDNIHLKLSGFGVFKMVSAKLSQ